MRARALSLALVLWGLDGIFKASRADIAVALSTLQGVPCTVHAFIVNE